MKANILIVSSETKSFVDSRLQELQAALSPNPPQLEVKHLKTLNEMTEYLAKAPNPHLILLDQVLEEAPLKALLKGLLESDPATCILLLMDHIPASAETMAWLDRGATGLLHRKFKAVEIAEPLKEALSKRMERQIARHPRTPVRHKIQMRMPSLEQALVAETLNLGTGGMFVRTVPPNIVVGDYIDFEFILTSDAQSESSTSGPGATDTHPLLIKMEEETKAIVTGQKGKPIAGTGSVVWIRQRAEKEMPEGIGIQFSELSPEAQRWISAFVATHRIRSFIPQS